MTTLIKARRLIDGNGGALDNGAVLVDGDRITAVGTQDELAPPEGVETIDGGQMTIMPGLVDSHVHLVNTGEAFSARVLFYDDRYAGTWDHGDYGGMMYGTIESME